MRLKILSVLHTTLQKTTEGLQTLMDETAWADIVREAQEAVELSLKGLLRE